MSKEDYIVTINGVECVPFVDDMPEARFKDQWVESNGWLS